MTDRELLEEIIENVEEIMETPYVVRKEKAVEVGIKLIMTGKVDFLLRKIDSLEEQNKRYREVINNINEKAMLYGVDEQVYEAIKEAIKALEGDLDE